MKGSGQELAEGRLEDTQAKLECTETVHRLDRAKLDLVEAKYKAANQGRERERLELELDDLRNEARENKHKIAILRLEIFALRLAHKLLALAAPLRRLKALNREKGRKGAEARWAGRADVDDIIKRLAGEKDELDDFLPADDLWDKFFGLLDAEHMEPLLTKPGKPDDAFIEYGSNRHRITFKTFRNRLTVYRHGG